MHSSLWPWAPADYFGPCEGPIPEGWPTKRDSNLLRWTVLSALSSRTLESIDSLPYSDGPDADDSPEPGSWLTATATKGKAPTVGTNGKSPLAAPSDKLAGRKHVAGKHEMKSNVDVNDLRKPVNASARRIAHVLTR